MDELRARIAELEAQVNGLTALLQQRTDQAQQLLQQRTEEVQQLLQQRTEEAQQLLQKINALEQQLVVKSAEVAGLRELLHKGDSGELPTYLHPCHGICELQSPKLIGSTVPPADILALHHV